MTNSKQELASSFEDKSLCEPQNGVRCLQQIPGPSQKTSTLRWKMCWNMTVASMFASHEVSCAQCQVHVCKRWNMQRSLGIKLCSAPWWIHLWTCPWVFMCFTPNRMGFVLEMIRWGWELWAPRRMRPVNAIVWLPAWTYCWGACGCFPYHGTQKNAGKTGCTQVSAWRVRAARWMNGWLVGCLFGWMVWWMHGWKRVKVEMTVNNSWCSLVSCVCLIFSHASI